MDESKAGPTKLNLAYPSRLLFVVFRDRKHVLAMSENEFNNADSWTVQYADLMYEDARRIGNFWYHRDKITREILPFSFQHRVVVVRENVIRILAPVA